MKKVSLTASIIAVLAIIISCARDVADTTDDAYKRVLDAWIRVNYGTEMSPTDSGVYVLSYTPGTGDAVRDCVYVNVHYTCTDLNGTVLSTNCEDLSKQVGTYSVTSYYGPDTWFVGSESIATGLEQILRTMRAGGKAKIALPYFLANAPYSGYNAFSVNRTNNLIYEFEVEDVIDDIFAMQDDSLRNFSNRYYDGMDTTAVGFYFKNISHTPDCDTISDQNTIKVWYVGKRLDGSVFDTNIRDTAKFYRIYRNNASYDPLEITYYSDLSEFLENSSMVTGFTYALSKMKYGDTAITFFRSDYGYSAAGSGAIIPEYCPLFFMIYIEPLK